MRRKIESAEKRSKRFRVLNFGELGFRSAAVSRHERSAAIDNSSKSKQRRSFWKKPREAEIYRRKDDAGSCS